MADKVLADLRRRLEPLLAGNRLRASRRLARRGLDLSRVHWAETWTADNLLRHTVFVGLREDKPAEQVRRRRLDSVYG